MGKVFCLFLLLLLFLIIVNLYAWLSGMNTKTVNIWGEIHLGNISLLFFATLFHVCNFGHYFANIVRYQMIVFEHKHTHTHTHKHIYIYIYMVFLVSVTV